MRRLIICCDGTWNTADQEEDGKPAHTNVSKMACRVAKRDGDIPQIVYYDQGVGTGNLLDRVSGGAFGRGLDENINEAYRFLIANYELGDQLFFFGFSRGAFTVRSIVGMIRKCGILKRECVDHYREAVDWYRNDRGPDHSRSIEFREKYALGGNVEIPVKFIGVWDTVGALGIPLRGLRSLTRQDYQFHDTELSGCVEYAYHALSIDERRGPFRPTLWANRDKPNQTVEQVWFCGVHSDVGGGYEAHGLSDIALQWMMEKAKGAGLALLDIFPPKSNPQGVLHDSMKLYYRLGTYDRPIGLVPKSARHPEDSAPETDPTQSLHPSVYERWDADPGYRPKMLREYFQRVGDPRADD